MVYKNNEILKYWEQEDTESMYDKYLINAEIRLIKSNLTPYSKILDAGCGEGEGTLEYSKIEGTSIYAADFSNTRLKKAKKLVGKKKNILFRKIDFLGNYKLDNDFDFIISQRFLINITDWELQKKVICDLMNLLTPNGKLLMLEGYQDGVDELNNLRAIFGLNPINVKWHNLFFNNSNLFKFITNAGYKIENEFGLGEYFFLTRGIRPYFDTTLNWNVEFNSIASRQDIMNLIALNTKFSRLKLWIIRK